ncbi:MAG: fumarylacetoacetase [Phycisphaerales bacterium]
MPVNETHDPGLRSWVESANEPQTDFPIQNLPFCQFDLPQLDHGPVGVVIGDRLLRLDVLVAAGVFGEIGDTLKEAAVEHMLDGIMIRPFSDVMPRLRSRLCELLRADNPLLRDNTSLRSSALISLDEAKFLRPSLIPNYTDFYASIHHARTVGSMFRPDNPLLPNYKHIPIGYHGRASSIVASGTDIRRPRGQQSPPEDPAAERRATQTPGFGPSKMLDYELEVGFFVGPGNELGRPIPIGEAESHIFGLCLVNDWSARDIQKWEYQPLGPFLAKSFATTISPFIVTMEALEPFRVPAFRRPEGDPRPLPYLWSDADQARGAIDLTLEVWLQSEQMRARGLSPVLLSKSNSFKDLYWTPAQLLTHHASNGCNLQPGDLLASGTVSGPGATERGCLLELTWDGTGEGGKPRPRKPLQLPSGETRTFLADGDEVIFKGYCERDGFRRIGFGECRGRVLPASAE